MKKISKEEFMAADVSRPVLTEEIRNTKCD